ncbi:heat shock factor-binding protein 1-like protein 1 [Spea bombifrons]|uniref:heat shock factor-binding protein 1-like protein 1 n=1 Tax=Spea bombifrons TaxID=233779 RepID=UPI0023491261|nr:heat shock factor-binding protein 1-like protein 1 [Spea bombifrons]
MEDAASLKTSHKEAIDCSGDSHLCSCTMADNDPKTPQDLSDFAESLMKNLQDKLQVLSDQLTQNMDEMGSKIDELQRNVIDLMTQAGIENPDDVVH